MRVYVMTDIEGISGVYCKEQVFKSECRHNEGRKFMTEDINACVAGLKAGGADEVYVHDCHGTSFSMEWDKATNEADGYICGKVGETRFFNIEECDALVLLGYHAMAGTANAILEHTFSSISIQNMYINNVKVGEIAVDAAIAGERGVPVIMVSGDDKACKEALSFLPDVVTAEVKRGLTCQGGVLLPAEKAHKLIYDKAKEAMEKLGKIKPFTFPAPITCKMEMVERSVLPRQAIKPYMTILDGRSFEVTADNVEEALWRAFT